MYQGRRRGYFRPVLQTLEDRLLLSGTSFGDRLMITEPAADAPTAVYGADLDGDGDLDILSSSSEDGKIAWYENLDGLGTFVSQQVITTEVYDASTVIAADLDGDGDLDVLTTSESENLSWYENLDGDGSFGLRQAITDYASGALSIFAADLDGDGDLDLLTASWWAMNVVWYENLDGAGSFGLERVIVTTEPGAGPVYALAADVDADGDLDVLYALDVEDDNTIAWSENLDGAGSFGPRQEIATDAIEAAAIVAADLDGDGDLDVLSNSSPDRKIAWSENLDGKGSFGTQQVVAPDAFAATSVAAADFDGDGDLDVLFGAGDKIAWHENLDGAGSFGPSQMVTTDVKRAVSVVAGDVDGDGDLDVLSASYSDNKIAWYENTDGTGSFGLQQVIVPTGANVPEAVVAADLDGDGDLDVLSASWEDDKIAWYENTDGDGSFGMQQVVTTDANGANSVFAADLDGDGDIDVLSASCADDKIAWYENIDGEGSFGAQRLITMDAGSARSVFAADLDGDGDIDVLSASWRDDKIAWYENIDGAGSFGMQQVVTTDADGAASVFAADLDGDGDLDVLSSSSRDAKIAWYENLNGIGSFGPLREIVTGTSTWEISVLAADLDGDGDLDVLSNPSAHGQIGWSENLDGKGTFGTQQVVAADAVGSRFDVADLDKDGDLDIVIVNWEKIVWHENLDGTGSFGPQQEVAVEVPPGQDSFGSLFPADVDADGDTDILATLRIRGEVFWYENLLATPEPLLGDMNLDGSVDHDDTAGFVLGLNDPAAYLATYAVAASVHGDTDRDGDLDFDDIRGFVELLDGQFAAGPAGNAASHHVPPSVSVGSGLDTGSDFADAQRHERGLGHRPGLARRVTERNVLSTHRGRARVLAHRADRNANGSATTAEDRADAVRGEPLGPTGDASNGNALAW